MSSHIRKICPSYFTINRSKRTVYVWELKRRIFVSLFVFFLAVCLLSLLLIISYSVHISFSPSLLFAHSLLGQWQWKEC